MRVCLLVLLAAAVACLDVDSDPCADVQCGEAEACVALASGPRCVCDAEHERVDDACVPLAPGEGEGEAG